MQHELAAFASPNGAWAAQLTGVRNHLALNESGSGYIVGERLSIGDLHAFNVLTNWCVPSPRAL